MRYRRIPDETIRRLPIYLRALLFSSESSQIKTSSKELAEFVGVEPWLIRKDFSYFGDFGTPGVGYHTEKLIKQIRKILKLDVRHKAALVGVGNLGTALLTYPGFKAYGFDIAAVFDNNPKKIGRKINDLTVQNVSGLGILKKRKIYLGIITVPLKAAQSIADALVGAGIKGILNFSPRRVEVPKKIKVITIDIAMDLARLPYYMRTG